MIDLFRSADTRYRRHFVCRMDTIPGTTNQAIAQAQLEKELGDAGHQANDAGRVFRRPVAGADSVREILCCPGHGNHLDGIVGERQVDIAMIRR